MPSSQRIAAAPAFVIHPDDESEPAGQAAQPTAETGTEEQSTPVADEPAPEPKPATRIRIRGGEDERAVPIAQPEARP